MLVSTGVKNSIAVENLVLVGADLAHAGGLAPMGDLAPAGDFVVTTGLETILMEYQVVHQQQRNVRPVRPDARALGRLKLQNRVL